MKIVTVNVSEEDIEKIKELVGENGLYPSRSELIRCAVRDFIIEEVKVNRMMEKWNDSELKNIKKENLKPFDDKNYVRIPVGTKDENDEPKIEYKTYKILREA